MGTRGCLWQIELDIMAVYGKLSVFLAGGARYKGCIWELVDVCGRWN